MVTCVNVPIREKTLVCAIIQALEKYGDVGTREGGGRKITYKEHRIGWLLFSYIDGIQRHSESQTTKCDKVRISAVAMPGTKSVNILLLELKTHKVVSTQRKHSTTK